MKKNYGYFSNEPGTYCIDKIPESGAFEYIYKNKNILLKVDQFGPSFIQVNPPSGMTVLQRKDRETFSPWRILFSVNGKVYNNFDIYYVKSFLITFKPDKCIYKLVYTNFIVETTLFVDAEEAVIRSDFSIKNTSNKPLKVKVLNMLNLECTDPSMAVWDKKEWYMKTSFSKDLNKPIFTIDHYSVNANKNERQKLFYALSQPANSIEMSYEKLVRKTNSFARVAELGNNFEDVFAYEQICGSLFTAEIKDEYVLSSAIKVTPSDENITYENMHNYFSNEYAIKNSKEFQESFIKMTNVRKINTKDENFNKFVNEFLPQELSWVIDLDRGWPSGMRGSRDCANDFMAFIDYDKAKVRETIVSLFKAQRFEDGWFPRQIPVGNSIKYDLREFVDSGCFVTELIYEYICSTDDLSILSEEFSYFDNDTKEAGLKHLIKAALFYTKDENIGIHGLIKLKGGDWLDCINKVGQKGIGETLMVTCQAIFAFKQVEDILSNYPGDYNGTIKQLNKYAKQFKESVKNYCLTDEGFYRALYSDDGQWYFSEKDIDGEKRVYVPSNAYAILSEIKPNNDKKVIKAILDNNKSPYGYKLFSKPFGIKPIDGFGKMGTGDFMANMNENGAIYNHGSQLFLLRALAKIGDHKNFYNVLNYALPYNEKFHSEKESCAPMYAITNCYSLTPTFGGRTVMIFLTGSIAMICRAIYNWMFGISYSIKDLIIKPCLPKQYADSNVKIQYQDNEILVKYVGFGSKISKFSLNGEIFNTYNNEAKIDKKLLKNKTEIVVELK